MKIEGVEYCATCKQDTLPLNGVCGFCDRVIASGELVADLVAQAKAERKRARWRSDAQRARDRRKPATHQVPE